MHPYPRAQRLADEAGVQIHLDCYCHTCRLWHRPGPKTPEGFTGELWDWYGKHRGHDFEFLSPTRRRPRRLRDQVWQRLGVAPWWMEYGENTNFKLAYGTATAVTMGLGSLASSSSFGAGRESTAVNNTTNRYIDSEITARLMTGTTPTADRELRLYGYQAMNPDTPTYPDTLTGSDANVTLTSVYTLGSAFALLGWSSNSSTSNVSYPLRCLSTAQLWGKEPKRWGLYVTHNTGVNLHATAGNHVLTLTPAYLTDT